MRQRVWWGSAAAWKGVSLRPCSPLSSLTCSVSHDPVCRQVCITPLPSWFSFSTSFSSLSSSSSLCTPSSLTKFSYPLFTISISTLSSAHLFIDLSGFLVSIASVLHTTLHDVNTFNVQFLKNCCPEYINIIKSVFYLIIWQQAS